MIESPRGAFAEETQARRGGGKITVDNETESESETRTSAGEHNQVNCVSCLGRVPPFIYGISPLYEGQYRTRHGNYNIYDSIYRLHPVISISSRTIADWPAGTCAANCKLQINRLITNGKCVKYQLRYKYINIYYKYILYIHIIYVYHCYRCIEPACEFRVTLVEPIRSSASLSDNGMERITQQINTTAASKTFLIIHNF